MPKIATSASSRSKRLSSSNRSATGCVAGQRVKGGPMPPISTFSASVTLLQVQLEQARWAAQLHGEQEKAQQALDSERREHAAHITKLQEIAVGVRPAQFIEGCTSPFYCIVADARLLPLRLHCVLSFSPAGAKFAANTNRDGRSCDRVASAAPGGGALTRLVLPHSASLVIFIPSYPPNQDTILAGRDSRESL